LHSFVMSRNNALKIYYPGNIENLFYPGKNRDHF
jgi:hypothetical protein